MKKSVNRAVSASLAGISILSPVLNNGQAVLAVVDFNKQSENAFDWVSGSSHNSKIELKNDTLEGNFWFCDDITKTLYAKGGTIVDFLVEGDSLKAPLESIEVFDGVTSLGKSLEGETKLSISLADIPSSGNIEVVYSFSDGSVDRIPFYDYFTNISGGVTSHTVDDSKPSLVEENKEFLGGTSYDSKYYKGQVKYSFQSDTFNDILPNVEGGTGYRYKLSINDNDYTGNTSIFTVNHDSATGKLEALVNLDNILEPLSGECNIELTVIDNIGNESKYNDTVFVDYIAPLIEGTISSKYWVSSDNVAYFNSSDRVEVSYNVSDTDTGVKNVTILKDSNILQDNANPKGSFVIDSEGTYEVKVEDNIGNVETYKLSEIVSGVTDTIKFDSSNPDIVESLSNIVEGWFKGDSSISFNISDDIGLKEVVYSINGQETVETIDGSEKTFSKVIDSSLLSSEYEILRLEVTATDMLGKESSYFKDFTVDINAPKLENAEVEGEITVIDGVGYSNKPLVLKGDVSDSNSGVKSVEVLKDGNPVSDTLPYTITSDGDYSLKLTDNVGNVSVIGIKDIAGKEFTGVVIDDTKPVIQTSINGEGISDNWYKDTAVLNINSSDNKNIKTIKYSINGAETVLDVNNTQQTLELDLHELANELGLVDLTYTVIDTIGNEETFSKVIKVDAKEPIVLNPKLDGDITMVGDVAYAKGNLVLSANIEDKESGIESIEVIKDGKVVFNSLPYTIRENGSYSIKIKDNAGHVVTKTLGELVNSNIDSVVVDSGSPVIETKINGKEVSDDWYKDKATLSIKAEDTNIKSIEYSINGSITSLDVNKDSHDLKLNLHELANDRGIVDFKYIVTDFVGNTTSFSKVIKVDTVEPIIEDAKLTGDIFMLGNIAFIKDDVELSANIFDNESDIAKIEVLRGFDVVSESLPYTIDRGGIYNVRVTDNAGHVVTKSLKEILNENIDNIVVDKDAPIVKGVIDGKEVSSNWYKDTARLDISTEDMSTIKSIEYTLNGQKFKEEVNNTNYETSIVLEDYVNNKGIVDFTFKAIDALGNETIYDKTIKIDTKSPEITNGKLKGDISILDNIGYAKDKLTLSATILDLESGVYSVEVFKDSQVVSTSLPYDIVDSGSYSVKVTDEVGHFVMVSLRDLTGVDVDSIIVDRLSPSVNVTINQEEVKNAWYKDNAKLSITSEDTSPIKSVSLKVNGKEVKQGNSSLSTMDTNELDLENYVNDKGIVSIEYSIVDYAGNETSYSKDIKVDTKDPILSDGSLKGTVSIIDGIAYTNEDIYLSAKSTDNESGVKSIEVLQDGAVISESLPFVIKESGSYSVKIYDGVGHSVTKTLKELVGQDIDRVVVDSDKPVISRLEGFEANLVREGVNWYKHAPSLKLSIKDNNLKNISIKVNDKEVINSISANNEYLIPLEDIEGSHKVEVSAVDKSDNLSYDKYEFKIDYSKPSIDNGTLDGEYKDRGFGLFFSSNPEVSVVGSDNGIGVKEYVLLDKEGSELNRNSTGKFKLGTGEYFIKSVDYFGNESDAKSVQELCNLENNRFVVDSSSPEIKSSRPEGSLDDFFNKNVTYDIQIKDSIGINNVKVYINGTLVDSFSANTDIQEVSLKADTSKVYKEDGEYIIKVVAEDNTGFTSEWSDTIKIDTTAPNFIEGNILGSYVDREDCIVFQSNPAIKVTPFDSGVGVKSITLVDKDGNRVSNTDGYFDLTTNEYSLIVEDRLGNISNPIPVSDVCNLPSNVIFVDGNKPVIDSIRPDGIIGDWFNGDVDYNISVKDESGISVVKVFINGNVVADFTADNKNTISKDLFASTKGIKSENCSYDVRVLTVDIVGNVSEWRDTIYIDTVAPSIDRFVITGNGNLEGDEINSSDKYGYYIDGKANVEVHISDGSYSSGMDKLYYTLHNADGSKEEGTSEIINGIASLSIREGFKGYISAYAVDKVGNIGSENRPSGIISEGGNTHINTSNISIELPKSDKTDSKGNYLYNKDVSIKSTISDDISGIRKVTWGIGNDIKGELNIDNNGNILGDTGSIVRKDKNLVVELNKDLFVSNNENSLSVWVEVQDRVGNTSKNSRVLSIDKDTPVINVSYDSTNNNSFYNKSRVATVSITERNFRSSDVKFEGVLGTIGNWYNVGGDTWNCDVTFSEDNDYQWSVNYTDMAGNVGNTYNSEKFTIDKTAPVLNVSFDNNYVENGNYYKDTRTATVTIVEKNFNPSLVNLTGNGTIGSWSSNGDTHTANIVYNTDGEYEFAVNMLDEAENSSSGFNSGKFIIDKTLPTLSISGVQNGVSYKKGSSFKVNLADDNIDAERCRITLSGRSLGEIAVVGGINGNTGEFNFSGVPNELKYDDLYTLKAVVYDKAGNFREQTINYSINRFGSRFAFLEERLLNNIVNKVDNIVLEETSVDRLDLASCKVVVIKDGEQIKIDDKYIKVEELGGTDSNWVYRYTVDKNAFSKDGKYQVQIYSKALDGTENSSLSQEYTFILDTTNPEIIVSGVEDGQSYKEVSRKATIEVRDLTGVESIKVLLNEEEVSLSEDNGLYTFSIPESNKKQNLYIEVVDKAGNTSTREVSEFLVTSNVIISLVNNSLAKGILGSLGVAILFLLAIVFKRRKATKKEEQDLAQEHAKMYQESITGSSTNSGSNSTLDR